MSRPRIKTATPGTVDSPVAQPQYPVEPQPQFSGEPPPSSDQPGELVPPPMIDSEEFEVSFGEPLDRTLDIETWNDGQDLNAVFARLDEEVSQALKQEDELRKQVRKVLFPMIALRPNAPNGAGVFKATRKQLQDTQVNVLFNGGVEACDGTCAVHDTLPLTVTQIGVCLVSYLGQQGAWGHRLYRKDLHMRGQDPLSEALESLQRRQQRAGVDQDSHRDQLSELGRRGIMSYAERAVLRWKSAAPWRMGHGQPAPYELLTGSGSMDFLRRSIDLLRELLLGYRRFVYVPSAPGERLLLTIGHALRPLEFAVVENSVRRLEQILTKGHLRGEHRERAEAFAREAGPSILIGVYRTYAESPPQIFYAHADCIQDAALIAMADSLLQSQRAFPTLIDLADTVCSSLFGTEGFNSTIQAAYAKHGQPLRFLGERETRR